MNQFLVFLRYNSAVGGTHYGTWYRMHAKPTKSDSCPQAAPLGVYSNNTAHSLGWYGLWIFERYEPREEGSCNKTARHVVSRFQMATAHLF